MQYPTLQNRAASLQSVEIFRGYNHNLQIGSGEFFDMENMTGDFFPVLSPRRKRKQYLRPEKARGMIAKDSLCYVDGPDFVINGYHVDMGLSDSPKTMVSMGAYVVILPDKKYINTADLTDWGNIEHSVTVQDVRLELCTQDGELYSGTTVGDTAPESPANLQLWMDTSSTPHVLKQYAATSETWIVIATTYVKLSATGIGKGFGLYDGVDIAGITGAGLEDLNGSHAVWAKGDDYLVVVGLLDQLATEKTVTVSRTMPDMEYLVEHENRLWGCHYGPGADGKVLNEIYACKLGDFKNWRCYMGTSEDSYTVSCGTDGPWTGAVSHRGHPLFFKEGFLHEVYGNYPANFQLNSAPIRGVQRGCGGSLAIVNEVLFYKALSGIMAYDGSLPTDVSGFFGNEQYEAAVAGSNGSKYYVSMRSKATGKPSLFVYDVSRGMWHREDDIPVEQFCMCRGELYAMADGTIWDLTSREGDEGDFRWYAQTGEIGIDRVGAKYISRITLRLMLTPESRLIIKARYDFEDRWETLGDLEGKRLERCSLPIRPKRCDHMVLRLEGQGDVKLYSMTLHMEEGSVL